MQDDESDKLIQLGILAAAVLGAVFIWLYLESFRNMVESLHDAHACPTTIEETVNKYGVPGEWLIKVDDDTYRYKLVNIPDFNETLTLPAGSSAMFTIEGDGPIIVDESLYTYWTYARLEIDGPSEVQMDIWNKDVPGKAHLSITCSS